jgi:hypothetical protein
LYVIFGLGKPTIQTSTIQQLFIKKDENQVI